MRHLYLNVFNSYSLHLTDGEMCFMRSFKQFDIRLERETNNGTSRTSILHPLLHIPNLPRKFVVLSSYNMCYFECFINIDLQKEGSTKCLRRICQDVKLIQE